MENNQLEQLAALDDLVSCFLVPAIEYFTTTAKDAPESTRAMAEATLVDAFLWLDLAARLRICSPEHTRTIVATYGHLLPNAKELFSGDWRFIYDQFFIRQAFAALSRGIATTETCPQTDSFQFGTAFQLLMREAATFALNPITREFTSALNFYRAEPFESLIVADINANDVLQALSEPANETFPLKARIVGGYFQTLQHMDAVVLMLGDHQRPPVIDPGEWAMFRLEVFQVLHWRLALKGNGRVPVRFELLTQSLEAALRSEATAVGVKLEPGGLGVATNILIAAWEDLALPAQREKGA
jgi:hypothetical protein